MIFVVKLFKMLFAIILSTRFVSIFFLPRKAVLAGTQKGM